MFPAQLKFNSVVSSRFGDITVTNDSQIIVMHFNMCARNKIFPQISRKQEKSVLGFVRNVDRPISLIN